MKRMLSILVFCFGLFAQDTTQTMLVDSVIKVYDGDTFYGNLSNLPDIFGKDIGIRLYGIDTPELTGVDSCNTALAKQARAYLDKRLRGACRIVLGHIGRDKYFRIDAIVYADGVNINAEMITKGFAKPYTGEGPKPKYTCK